MLVQDVENGIGNVLSHFSTNVYLQWNDSKDSCYMLYTSQMCIVSLSYKCALFTTPLLNLTVKLYILSKGLRR